LPLTHEAVSLEAHSHPHLHPFLISVLEPPAAATRASKKKTKSKEEQKGSAVDVTAALPYTPLSELTVTDMDPEQIWAQTELRAAPVGKIVKESVMGAGADLEEAEEEGDLMDDDDDDDSEGSDEEMTEEEFRRMLLEGNGDEDGISMEEYERMMAGEDDSDEGSDEGSEEEGDEDEEEDEEDEDDDVQWKGLGDGESGSEVEVDEDDEEEGDEEEDEDDGEDMEDDFEMGSDEDEDGGDGDEVEVDEEDDDADLLAAGPSRRSKPRHKTLDDDFFSIDDFNRQTEEAEASNLSSGRLGEDEDEEDLGGDVGQLMLRGAGDDECESTIHD
jgi:U3 small nucleolar RNA-associated protein MPP10